MCDPGTLAVASMVAAGAGTAVQSYGAYQSGQAQAASLQAQQQNYLYQAQVAENNAKIARQNAMIEGAAGAVATENQMLKTRAALGKTVAGQAAAGVDVNTGSNLRAQTAVADLGMADALTIRSDSARRAWSYEVQATNADAQSEMDRRAAASAASAATAARRSGAIAAAGTLLSGASTVAGRYADWQTRSPTAGGGGTYNDPTIPGMLY